MKPLDILLALRYFGAPALTKTVWHRLLRKTAYFKHKFPATPWGNLRISDFIRSDIQYDNVKSLLCAERFLPLEHSKKHLPQNIFSIEKTTLSAEKIMAGTFTCFSKIDIQTGKFPNWHLNPFNNSEWPADIHWSQLNNFSRQLGDVKIAWELSRFSWAYSLVLAYMVTGSSKYARRFWELFEDWLRHNQPNLGVNWGCGQECALRVMACCFAVFGLKDAPETSEEQVGRLLLALAIHGERIEGHISDALRQKNNHALSEACGLYTIGTLMPFFKKAEKWKKMGSEILEQQGLQQIYPDGSYIQHSMNYHRLMLQIFLWCLQLAKINRDSFSDNLKDRLLKATEFLYQMQDSQTGRVPNYGANDGVLILPLNNCDYLDYRPALQSCWYLLKRERLFDTGPWDEDLLWIFGPDAIKQTKSSKARVSSQFSDGGYYTIRASSSWAMMRCHSYKERVGHVDTLHLDLWADGMNLLRDCGSYKYFSPDEPEFEKYFKSIWAHNTIIVDDLSPLRLVSRFMYLPWPKAKLLQFTQTLSEKVMEGTHFAYSHRPWNVIHTRSVKTNNQEQWIILDKISGQGQHKLELRWHLPYESAIIDSKEHSVRIALSKSWVLKVECQNDIRACLFKADSKGGWESLWYGHKQPISTLSVLTFCQLRAVFKTILLKNYDKLKSKT
jgi:uncharacterized heparinase superfamily protein